MNTRKWTVRFVFYQNGKRRECIASGRNAQTLLCLVTAGKEGITAAEISCWANRLGAYVHCLRKDYGLDIITHTQPHEGGFHGRYELLDAVELIEVIKP